MATVNFSHSGNIGDVWASIPACKQYYKKTGNKIVFYLVKDVSASYYEGAVHPTKSEKDDQVMLNAKMCEMMIPVLKIQDWCEDAKIWIDEHIDLALSDMRFTYVGMPNFSINRWYFYAFPDLACDLSKEWLYIPDAEKDFSKNKILINRTERYRNESIDYSFLKPFEDDCLFIGTMREYNNFCMAFDLNIRKLIVNDFLEYAQAIKQSKFYISNQSQGFQLAQGQFHPTILEICNFAPNCIPIGENIFDFFAQDALEYYFHRLNNNEKGYLEEIKKASEEALKI